MTESLYFLVVHLIAFFALLVNVGLDYDGYDNIENRLTLRGKIATFGLLPIAFLFLLLFMLEHGFNLKFSVVYLGFGITVCAFTIPFLSTCHNSNETKLVKLNFVGWLTLIIGFSGLLASIIWAAQKNQTDAVENYMEVLGQFIAGTSAFIALSGTTIQTDSQGRNRLTDLGHVASLVILIGFLVAVINGLLDSKKDDELSKTAEDTKITLLTADSVISKQLKPNIDIVNSQMEDVRKTVVPTLNGILNQLRDLQSISKKIDVVRNEAAKAKDLEEMNQNLTNYKNTVEEIKNTIINVKNLTDELQQAQQQLAQKIDNQNNRLASLETKTNKIDDLEEKINSQIKILESLSDKIQTQNNKFGQIQESIKDLNEDLNKVKTQTNQIDNFRKQLQEIENKLNAKNDSIR